jgi:polyisoprenoid-binding protein YceI
MGAHASLTISRQDYGVTKSPAAMIANEVKIDLNVEAHLAPPAPAPGK